MVNHCETLSIGGRYITILRFVLNIDGLPGSETELDTLVKNLDEISSRFDMEISAEKIKLVTNSANKSQPRIKPEDRNLRQFASSNILVS